VSRRGQGDRIRSEISSVTLCISRRRDIPEIYVFYLKFMALVSVLEKF
jgi:hypothetical protein